MDHKKGNARRQLDELFNLAETAHEEPIASHRTISGHSVHGDVAIAETMTIHISLGGKPEQKSK